MPNELILLINLLVVFGGVLLAYYLFDTRGLTCFTVFATIAANIEVLILIAVSYTHLDVYKRQR